MGVRSSLFSSASRNTIFFACWGDKEREGKGGRGRKERAVADIPTAYNRSLTPTLTQKGGKIKKEGGEIKLGLNGYQSRVIVVGKPQKRVGKGGGKGMGHNTRRQSMGAEKGREKGRKKERAPSTAS